MKTHGKRSAARGASDGKSPRAPGRGAKRPPKAPRREGAAGGPPLNVHEAKASFSSLIDRVVAGETVMICRRNVPVAEVRPIQAEAKKAPRPIGLAAGEFEVPASFHDPLPGDLQSAFEGRGP